MVAFAPALAIPFAEAVGITITGLSLAAITDKVSQYVNQNPEESKAILKMILPASVTEQGLSTLFKKKAKSPEKEVDSEDIDPQDLSREDKAKIMKEYGKSRGQNKRERMIEIAKQLGLVGEEKEKQKVFDEVEQRYENDEVEENIKPKFDYTKFFKADGGRIGFANGGRGYSDYASPSSTTASQDFATQAVSGGQTDYDGGGGGNDQPITEIRPNFNYNIDPFSINPRLNFKNIASIIYLQEFLDKKARGEDPDLEADINFRDQFGNLDIFGNLGRSGNIVGANIPFLQSGIGSLAYSPDIGLAAGLRGNLTEDLSGGVSFQDGQQNVNFNYNKGPFSADFTSGPEENNIQVGFKMPFADGGRIGYVGGGLATTQDFANALKSVSAGTTYQQQIQAKEYARNEASNLLSQAMRSADPNKGPGLQGIYDTFFRTTLSPGIRPKTFTPDSSGRMIMYSARDRDAILDSMANQMLNTTPYAAPRPKTYRTVSPEAQALNMSQSTYEDIIRSGADPKQYYIDYQNRMMTEGGNYGTPGTSSYTGPQLLKYGQVIGGPGMVIAGPGTAPGATPPTQAQMNQMMQNNPAGYMDFADLVKTYSADPYKGLQEEIKDMVDGRDTGYMRGQDYYDINVLGLDGRGIAEKYGLQYADGGRIGFANGGIENIIGKNLDNVTNVAKGLDKEMLDMTFDDKYYRDKIQPAKLGQAPIPGRMEMMLKSKPFTAVGIGMRPGTFGERAQPTKAASQFLNTLGKGAKFVGTKVGPLSFMDIFASTPLGADDEVTDEMRQSIEMSPTSTTGIMVDANDGFRTSPATYYNSAPNFNADVLREEEDAQYNLPQKNIFQRAGNFIGKLNLEDYIPFIGQKSLTGTMGRGIGNLFQNIAPARYGTSQRAYNALTPQGRSTVGSIYGPGGIMSGYNAVSAFGRGPLESITNRISKTRNPVIKEQLITAAKKITDSGQDTSKTGINAVTRKGTYAYDDVNVGGRGTGGSGGKIVCTMMNESYGFGNFRNKIWLKHSKDLPKEYEIGYHTIFLPLVNFAKKEGKVNKLVKKILEHIAKHRTIDLKQEMRGKTHTLGRVYRKILEPICLMVGKIKKEVK
jgi:hypothetical protein